MIIIGILILIFSAAILIGLIVDQKKSKEKRIARKDRLQAIEKRLEEKEREKAAQVPDSKSET